MSDSYVLATGGAAADRLQLLDRMFGPTTRDLLTAVGLERAAQVADIGCGTGLVASWAAQRIRPGGSVTAVDANPDQLAIARSVCGQLGLGNVEFRASSAYGTGLERETFDIVFSRFLLCHLTRPADALSEMCALVKPGGVLVCEDYDAASVESEPPTDAYRRLREISMALDQSRGVDSHIGPKVHRLLEHLPVKTPLVRFREPAFLVGPEKRFWELTLREAAPAVIATGVATQADLDEICAAMASLAVDSCTRVIVARVWQTWAVKRG